MKSKRGVEFNFAVMFAIIVGAAILVLAIYMATKYIHSSRVVVDTGTAKQLTILFEPMETGLAEGINRPIVKLSSEVKIYNDCDETGSFGTQRISLDSASNIGTKWNERSVKIEIKNKYIFSDDIEQGKSFYFFSEAFRMPFKVSEIIMFSSEKYCFVNYPEFIIDEIKGLKVENIKFDNCTNNDVQVCFGRNSCKINVIGQCTGDCDEKLGEYEYGYVLKNSTAMYYAGNLIYGAIVSNPKVYECNVKRLVKRMANEAALISEQQNFLTGRCQSSVNAIPLARANMTGSIDIIRINEVAKSIETENQNSGCKLW